jgi:quercetin dioxygenase-like cupin family protein
MFRLFTASLLVMFIVQQGDPVVHMSKEPRHKVVFESGTIRVQDIQIPPGDTTLFHTHDHAVLYVPISSSRTRSQLLGQDWTGGGSAASGTPAAVPAEPERPGRVSSPASYVETPMTHRVSNVGERLFRLISIGNLSKGSDIATDDVSGLAPKPELLNRYYRAFRVSLTPGLATAQHTHAWPVVVVQQTAGEVAVEGSHSVRTSAPGAFVFHASGSHQLKNPGSTTVDVIEVELRGGTTQ